MAGTKHEMYNLEKDSDENAVEGVQILNDDSMILETDENGKYSFGGNGTYNLSFKYGTKLDKDNYKLNRDTLKYNGQDYTVVATKDGMTMGCDPGYLSKINELKDSFTEVYIVIDYSQTMRDDSTGTSRLEIVKESALKFVQALYEEAEDIPSDGNITDYTTKSKYMNPVIGNNGERYVKVVLSRVLSAEILDDFAYRNQAEIIQYSNNDSRRINFSDGNGINLSYKYPIAGNFIPTAAYEHLISGIENHIEIDTAIANPVQLIPPTWLRKYNMFGMTEYKNYLKTIFTSCRNLFEIRK